MRLGMLYYLAVYSCAPDDKRAAADPATSQRDTVASRLGLPGPPPGDRDESGGSRGTTCELVGKNAGAVQRGCGFPADDLGGGLLRG